MEDVKKGRVKSMVLSVILLGLIVMTVLIWVFFYRHKNYLSDATGHVDGTIETGTDGVEESMKKLAAADPADVIRDRAAEDTRVAFVFTGVTEEDDTNEAVLQLLKDQKIKASFALSAAEGLENDEFMSNLLTDGNDLVSNGISGESGVHAKSTSEMLETMQKSRETLSTAADETVPLLYCSGTRLTGDVLRAASVSGYTAVLDPDEDHVLDNKSFETKEDAVSFVNGLHGDVIVTVNLREEPEKIQDEDAVRVEKPAIDKQPDLDDTAVKKEEPVPILTQVEWLVQAVNDRELATEYVKNFEKTPGMMALKETLDTDTAEAAVLYRSCLTDQNAAGIGAEGLPASDDLDALLNQMKSYQMQMTFFVNPDGWEERNGDFKKIAAAGNSIGITLPEDDFTGISITELFDRMYEAVRTAQQIPGYAGLYLANDGEPLEDIRKCAKLLNLKVILPEEETALAAGSLRLVKPDAAGIEALKLEADEAGVSLTDMQTLLEESGVLSAMTPEAVNALRKENGGKLETVYSKIYTTERAVNFSFYGMGNQTTVMDAVERLKKRNGKGTFFVTLDELSSCQNAIEYVKGSENEIGIYYKSSSDYPKTFDAVMNYINNWKTYAKWRYGIESDLIFVTEEVPDEVLEAVSASGCRIIRNTLLVVRNEDKDLTLDTVSKSLDEISHMRVMRGSFVCFNMNFYVNDKNAEAGNTVFGAVLDGFIDKHIDTLAYRSHETGEIEDGSRFAISTASSILNSPDQYEFCDKTQTDITLDKNVLTNMASDEEREQFIEDRYYGNLTVDTEGRLPGFTAEEIQRLDKNGTFTDDPVIFLTFDDWGTEQSINELLYVLDKHQVKATFFIYTGYVDTNPNLLRTIAMHGHQIASHSDGHLVLANSRGGDENINDSLTEEQAETLRKDLVVSYNKLYRYVGDVVIDGKPALTKMFRPPTLAVSKIGLSQVFDVGFEYSISGAYATSDYKMDSYEAMIEDLTKTNVGYQRYETIHNGSVVVMHMQENAKYTAQALDTMIPLWKEQGYSFARIDDYLGK